MGAAVTATLILSVGCGFVQDDPAGSAAPGERGAAGPTVTTIRTDTPSTTPGSGTPGTPGTPGASGPSGPGRSPGADTSTTTTVAVSPEDRALLTRCELVLRFRQAGLDVVVVSSREPERLVDAIRRFDAAATAMIPALRADERDDVEAAMATVRAGLPGLDFRSPQQIIDQWNGILRSNLSVWRRAVLAMTAACPTGPADMPDQTAEFLLGQDLRPDFDVVVGLRPTA